MSFQLRNLIYFFASLLILTNCQNGLAAPACSQVLSVYNALTVKFGQQLPPQKQTLSQNGLRVLVWNIHKAADPQLSIDFKRLSGSVDLSLLQESISEPQFIKSLSEAQPSLRWVQSVSWTKSDGTSTGVATGSEVPSLREWAFYSPSTEPIMQTPKTILFSEYKTEKNEVLLVANVHALNFVMNETFSEHMNQLLEVLKKHQGPLLVAGDFNTWNAERLTDLKQKLARLKLSSVELTQEGILILDHIFVRGLKKRFQFSTGTFRSSDHSPLLVDFVWD